MKIKNKIIDIDNFDLDFDSYSLIQIEGENGSGKTLLMRYLFERYNNYNVSFLNQSNELILNKDILSNIVMTDDEKRKGEVKNLIKELGLSYLLELKHSKLSGGEKRIILLLRAYFNDCEIIFVDEPTNDLDYKMVDVSLTILSKLIINKYVICVSHDDRVASIEHYDAFIKDNVIINNYINENTDIIDSKKILSKSFIRKYFKIDYISFILTILLIFITVFETLKIDNNNNEEYILNDNQVELCLAGSSIMDFNTVPFEFIDLLYENNMFEKVSKYKEIMNSSTYYKESFNLQKITSTNKYTLYPYEYYDRLNKRTYKVTDYYLEKYYGSTLNRSLCCDDYFISPNYFQQDEEYKMDIVKYRQCVDELNKKEINEEKLQLRCVIVILNDSADLELLRKDINRLKSDEYSLYLKTNLTTRLLVELNKYITMFSGINEIVIAFAIIVGVDLFNIFLSIKNNQKNLLAFYDYGYSINSIEHIYFKKRSFRIFKIVPLVGLFIFNYLYIKDLMHFSFLIFLILPSIFIFEKTITYKLIDYKLRWYYRC